MSTKITLEGKEIDLVKLKIGFTLNEQQKEALEHMSEWFSSNTKEPFVLMGYAGTGKSSLTKIFISFARAKKPFQPLYITAPTHRAKKVLSELASTEATTLHSLLGLYPDINLEELDVSNLKFDTRGATIFEPNSLVIIDESSMINDVLLETILQKLQVEFRCKILFIGDPAQLKPVKQERISSVFKLENTFELTKVERQSNSNPLSLVLDDIRNDKSFLTPLSIEQSSIIEGKGIEIVDQTTSFLDLVKKDFLTEEFAKDKSYTRLLAYTNKKVVIYNKLIRDALGYKEQFEVGELLMSYSNFSSDSGVNECEITNSSDYEILRVEKDSIDIESREIPGYLLVLKDLMSSNKQKVFVLDNNLPNETREEIASIIEDLRMEAIFNNSGPARKKYWARYYQVANSFSSTFSLFLNKRTIKSKGFDYGYSHTIHKSQGGTYTNIFVDHRDISLCEDRELQNQLKYVALSRPTNKATVLI